MGMCRGLNCGVRGSFKQEIEENAQKEQEQEGVFQKRNNPIFIRITLEFLLILKENMQKVDILQKKYPEFVYKNYSWKIVNRDFNISFNFLIKPNIKFSPKIVIKNVSSKQIKKVGDRVLNNLVFNLGLIELLSYWKATCSPKIIIEAGFLNKEQINWWKDLINNGMSQFFYENKINFTNKNFLNIINGKKELKSETYQRKFKNHILVPIGGGKDSIVTLEILKKAKKEISCFSLNLSDLARQIIRVSGCKKMIIVERKLDKKLIELNQKDFLNGHTPFSAYLAFLSVILAVIFDKKYISFSNERSSNEGNVRYLGRVINHQYSKSFDFEQKFRKYSKKYLAKNAEYFSFLRPLYEIQIAKLFLRYPKYFDIFLSCNEAMKTYSGTKKPARKWCGKCPKCLFAFMIFYPFIKKEKLIKIFNKNLLDKKELLPLMLELIGERKFKPFECVGTKKESLSALYLDWEKEGKRKAMPLLLKYFETNILPKHRNLKKESENIMNSWNNQNNLAKQFKRLLRPINY